MDFNRQKFKFETQWIEAASLRKALENKSQLSLSIQKLSDIYVSGEGSPKVWEDPALSQAYLAYFLPLNSIRMVQALQLTDTQELLANIESIYELGSGPGTAQISFADLAKNIKWIADEEGTQARDIHKHLSQKLNLSPPHFQKIKEVATKSLGLFSYVLTETELPAWAYDCDALFILEASMRNASRNLMELRQKLIANGYTILSPCTHQQSCPLLLHTKKDFCHFRVHLDKPEYMTELEKHLPMRNDSLTFSFLSAKKTNLLKQTPSADKARVVGEVIIEKGKLRQPICRSSKKEQLSWLKRKDAEIKIPESGSVFEIPGDARILDSEIRLN